MSFDTEVAADTPYAYWKMTGLVNGASVLPDSSGNARDGSFQGSTGWTVGGAGIFPAFAESLTFTGTSGKLMFFSTGAITTFSEEIVLKPTGITAATKGIWAHTTLRALSVTSTGAIAFNPAGTTFTSAAGVLVNGTAAHVVATYDSATGAYTVYVNGTLVLSGTAATGSSVSGFMRVPWITADGNELAALFSNWAMYTAVLSPTRIAAHYAAALVGPVTVLAPPMIAPAMLLPAPATFAQPVTVLAPPMIASPFVPAPVVVTPVRVPVGAMTADPSQGWGFDLGTRIDVQTREAAVVAGSQINRHDETYPVPTLVDGRPVS